MPYGYDKIVNYYRCACSCLFRNQTDEFPDTDKPIRDRKQRYSYEYLVHVYFPLIEELTFGRKMLEIGYRWPFIMRIAKDRGWIVTGIEKSPKKKKENGIELIHDDFMNYNFGVRKFDLIWMNHVIEHIKDWYKCLMKIHELLRPEGIVFISSPDANLLDEYGMDDFLWGDASHRIIFSSDKFKSEMERFAFNTIMIRSNKSQRFPGHCDFHGIWQKSYYDEPYIGGYDKGIDFGDMFKKVQEKK